MGNALSFLEDKDNRDKYRKGSHNAKCKKKIEEHIKNKGTTVCPDYILIQKGVNVKGSKVNDKIVYTGSINKIGARIHEKREERKCECCGDNFKPYRMSRPLSVKEKEDGRTDTLTIWCSRCTQMGTRYRQLVKAVGGVEEYTSLREESMIVENIRKLTSLRDLFHQLDIKTKLNLEHKTLNNRITEIIEKAYKENEHHHIKHYDFDF